MPTRCRDPRRFRNLRRRLHAFFRPPPSPADQKLADQIFSMVEAEWKRTLEALNEITGTHQRLADNPTLARSIRHRFPYISPLNHLQVELIRRWRCGVQDERTRRCILTTINGIAAGLRNTG